MIGLAISIITYLFYLLGYAFLQGYYCGGNANEGNNIAGMFNSIFIAVPFPLQYTIVLAVEILILFSFLGVFYYGFIVKQYNVAVDVIFAGFIAGMHYAICKILAKFTGESQGNEETYVWVLGIIIAIQFWLQILKGFYKEVVISKMILNLLLGTLVLMVYLFMLSVGEIQNLCELERSLVIWEIMLLASKYFVEFIGEKEYVDENKKLRKMGKYFNIKEYSDKLIKVIFVSISLVAVIYFSYDNFLLWSSILLVWLLYGMITWAKVYEQRIEQKNEGKRLFLIVLGGVLAMLGFQILYFYTFFNIYCIGNYIGKNTICSHSRIEIDDRKIIEGNIVAQSGNTYYISTPERKLIIINSDWVCSYAGEQNQQD